MKVHYIVSNTKQEPNGNVASNGKRAGCRVVLGNKASEVHAAHIYVELDRYLKKQNIDVNFKTKNF